MVQILDVGELAVEIAIILIGEQAKRISHGNVTRLHPALVDELAEQSQDHLGRGIHVIVVAHHVVRLWIDPPAGDATHQVYFDGDLLSLLISHVPVAMGLVEVFDEGIPGFSIAGLTAELLNHARHHAVHHRLVGFVALPPVSLSRSLPVGGPRVMCPNDSSRIKTFPDTDGQIGNRVAGQDHLVAGLPKGAADS